MTPSRPLADGLGSTTGLTDDNGELTDTYSYDIFGAERSHTGSSPTELTYTGEQNDPNGLAYLRARYYDPSTGRFLSKDPVPYLQRYAYVFNSPTNLVDPSGLSPLGDQLGETAQALSDCAVAASRLNDSAATTCLGLLLEILALEAAFIAELRGLVEDAWQRVQDAWDWAVVPVADCLTDWECFWQAAQLGPYAAYYGAYKITPYVPPGPIGDVLVIVQISGLTLDAVGDAIKDKGISAKIICDEGRVGSIIPGKPGDGPGGVPETYHPGIHEGCTSVDISWPGEAYR